ncbi:MAG: hypothetical protein ACLFR7_10230 [Opitutales bacterium]
MKDDEKKVPSPADAGARVRDESRPDSDLPPDADAEERFNDFWKRNGALVFGAIALLAVIVVGRQVLDLVAANREDQLQALYAQSTASRDALLDFAQSHDEHPLGGMAYLELADQTFTDGDFLQSSKYYDAAIAPLSEVQSPFAARARLGAGLARLRQGDATGAALLEDLALDAEVMENLRAEAAYHHAVASWEADDLEAVRRSLDLLDGFTNTPEWRRRGLELASQIPGLRQAEVMPATAPLAGD